MGSTVGINCGLFPAKGARYYTAMNSTTSSVIPAGLARSPATQPGTVSPGIRAAVSAQAQGALSSRDLLESARAAHEAHRSLNAIAWVDFDAAARDADALDAQRRAGSPLRPLHGVPVTIKDLFNVTGMPTAAGTRARLPDFGGEALAVSRLRAAGALVFAKTNMHEIALGATGENIWTGDVLNPHDPARQAGGSSSGAGVAVAVGIGLAGVGSDTGGSVRIPAAFSGVVGFKPTFGAIPLAGALHLSWTCDHAGPLTRSVDDAAVMFEAMSGRRTAHARVARRPRLAVPVRWLAGRLHPAMRVWFESMLADWRTQADITEVVTPVMMDSSAQYTVIARAEAAHVHREILASGGEGFSPGVLAPMRLGEQVALRTYLEALQFREALRAELDALLRDHDALVLPSSAVPPPLRGQTEVEVESGIVTVREAVLGQTLPFSFAGFPAISLPGGSVESLPASIQLVGARDRDAALLGLARWIEGQAGR
jgi:aspartyl-tRNA(Asn)/glutamyl-tRNA(Gln) amidotransferase subunit A